MTFHDIFRMPSQKFQIWKQSVDGDKKRSIEEVDDDEGDHDMAMYDGDDHG